MSAVQSEHWLTRIARKADLEGADGLEVDPRTSSADAWAQVTSGCGISQAALVHHVAATFRLAEADVTEADGHALKLIPKKLATRYLVFPLRQNDRTIVVATSNPTDVEIEQAIAFSSGRLVSFEVASPEALAEAIELHYSAERDIESFLRGMGVDVTEGVSVEERAEPESVSDAEADAEPIVQLTNVILSEAVNKRASDIHIEPSPHGGIVRLRIDDVLQHYMQMPMPALHRVISRVKVLGKLDIADRLRPQDGSVRLRIEGRVYDLRLSTVPTQDAEKAVIRLLDPKGIQRLAELELPDQELDQIRSLLSHREGIVMVTGPTGSGKTTTLYAALTELATGHTNIMTIEDPVEYRLPGVTQIEVEPRRNVTFAAGLRAILRQDPDVILVGEIRDPETAEVAAKAAMTGHLVLATLHANDAVGAIDRLQTLDLDRATIAATLRGALAQRLVRRVCEKCAEPIGTDPTVDELKLAARYNVTPTNRAVGCQHCDNTGYRGRLPLIEVFTVTRDISELIAKNATSTEIERAALAGGMRHLHEVARRWVDGGQLTLEEADRVLGEFGEPQAPSLPIEPHILVVDDDSVARRIARRTLEQAGYKVSESADGETALRRLREDDPYSLVVLDLDMPHVGGREVVREVRNSAATAGLPVLVLTGTEGAGSEIELIDAGADDYLRKPLDPPRFISRVKAVLRRAGM